MLSGLIYVQRSSTPWRLLPAPDTGLQPVILPQTGPSHLWTRLVRTPASVLFLMIGPD